MNVDAIKNGIVIDHIQAGKGMEIYRFLMGNKDIIKIDGEIGVDLNMLGYIDPGVTIDVIENETCVRKYRPELPEQIRDVVRCKNPRCISTVEQELPQIFRLVDKRNKLYRCIYCDGKLD